jgi:uncharacterized protein YdaU (DUF1376 family)
MGDYLRDTARLSMLEHGAYSLLLDFYYAEERSLPLDRDEVYLMVRAMNANDRKAVDKILRLYFTEGPDGYHQKRVDHEIAMSRTARINGKHGGRKTKPEAQPDREPKGKPDTEPDAKPKPKPKGKPERDILQPPTTNHHPPAANRQSRGTRLDGAWTLPDDWLDEAMRVRPGFGNEVWLRVADGFRDYWIAQPGQKGVKLDWLATWRNWARNEAHINGRGARPAMSHKDAERKKFFDSVHGASHANEPIDVTPERVD